MALRRCRLRVDGRAASRIIGSTVAVIPHGGPFLDRESPHGKLMCMGTVIHRAGTQWQRQAFDVGGSGEDRAVAPAAGGRQSMGYGHRGRQNIELAARHWRRNPLSVGILQRPGLGQGNIKGVGF